MGPRSGQPLPPLPGQSTATGGVRSGEPLPPPLPVEPSTQHHTEPIDRSALWRPAAGPTTVSLPTGFGARPAGPVSPSAPRQAPTPHAADPALDDRGAVYQTRRGGQAASLVAVTCVSEVLVGWALIASVPAAPLANAIAGLLMIVGLPLFAVGLYAALGGAAASPGQGYRAWLRTPLAYLPIALVIFLAAGVAAGAGVR